jgi:DNA-binding NtrC family response regulator
MKQFRSELADIARAPGSVLIVGESGTGKELVAEAIHRHGEFAARPFIPVNCAALPRELFESELFGHERGAFTGSGDAASGLLRAAGQGTIFLDEITEMPLAVQAKLLRALEQRAVRPVGGVRELPMEARIVAATNVDPERSGESSALRRDLFYRLCVHRIDVPPLRERSEDIPLLIEHFLREIARRGHVAPDGFSAESLRLLARYEFRGNVRELRNIVEHTCASCGDGWVEPCHLPQRLLRDAQASRVPPRTESMADPPAGNPAPLELREVERRHIEYVLTMTGGNKAHAARLLGVSRHQLYLKLERLGLLESTEQ